jgi:hypothetical protein
MKFPCLAYCNEDGWNTLIEAEKQKVLTQDAIIRDGGNLMSAVGPNVTTIKNWGGNLEVKAAPFSKPVLTLAGFSVIETDSVDDVIALVKNSPCARAKGATETYPFWKFD